MDSNFDKIMEDRGHFKNEEISVKSRKFIFLILLCNIFFISCEKDDLPTEKIIGKWKLVEEYSLMMGGVYSVDTENQRIEEYTKDNLRILYDYHGNEIVRCNYRATKSVITIYGEEINGTKWENSYRFWLSKDTLKIRYDGGFEFYNEFLVRIK